MRNIRVLGAFVGFVSWMAVIVAGEGDARACGGCIQPAPPPATTEVESVITDEKMIFSISQDQTTLYDEIEYSGSPADFAWVLPVKGTVTVGLSADILFQTIGTLTATSVTSPPTGCPPPPTCGGGGGGCGTTAASFASAPGFSSGASPPPVTVTSQKQVGPYETVQLHSTDGTALNQWLAAHKYVLSKADAPVIAAYVAAHFDFLALRLAPGEDVHAMQPVRVTSKGASISLPLHMVAVGTGATTGITIWVVADGRWEPKNFPSFTIADSEIAWDWASNSSNYETLRLAKEATFNGRGWQIESSLELSQYLIGQSLGTNIQSDQNGVGGYAPGNGDAGDGDAGSGDTDDALGSDASGGSEGEDAGEANGGDSGDAGTGDAGEAESGEGGDASPASGEEPSDGGADGGAFELDSGFQLGNPAADDDLAVLFAGIAGTNVRITRMRSDVAHSALSEDMVLQASADQGELTNTHVAQQEIGQPLCTVYDDNCAANGEVPRNQATANAGGGCTTTRSKTGARTTLALLLALAGLEAVRLRRRRTR